jgi:alkanesulfonate monooxygenase SsuD/methylene tetrahydromethanopterin reductase-like flavin-dependent oxidoreductase (luciferase family)
VHVQGKVRTHVQEVNHGARACIELDMRGTLIYSQTLAEALRADRVWFPDIFETRGGRGLSCLLLFSSVGAS